MREIFRSYILPAILIGGIGVLGFGIVTKSREHNDVYRNIDDLSQELERVQKENEALRASIESFKDPETIDREARQRLNLKKEGEHVVVILPPDGERVETTAKEISPETEERSLWQKFIDIFKKD